VVLHPHFTEDPADVVDMVKALEGGADIVAGTDGERDEAPRTVRWSRWLAERVLGDARRGAPVSELLEGLRVYRIIVLKKAFREDDSRVVESRERWPANVELMQRLAPHARRIEEVGVTVRHALRTRESRFRPLRVLRGLVRFRGLDWSTDDEAERAA
jgi:hypothetical protein